MNLAIGVMIAKEKQLIIQCAMARWNEIRSNQIPVSGESLLDTDSESFHGFTDTEIQSALRSLRGCAVLEDSDTESFHGFTDTEIRSALGSLRGWADAETDEESGTLEFVSPTPNTNFVTIKGYHVKTGYKCQEVRIH